MVQIASESVAAVVDKGTLDAIVSADKVISIYLDQLHLLQLLLFHLTCLGPSLRLFSTSFTVLIRMLSGTTTERPIFTTIHNTPTYAPRAVTASAVNCNYQ